MLGATACRDPSARYRVVGELGRGCRAVVLEAEDTWLARRVALKRAHPGQDDLLLEEARRLARAGGRHVPALLDVLPGPPITLVLERLEGETLRAHQRDAPPPVAADLSPIVQGLLDALAALHERDLVHGDLKPENIWCAPNGEIELLDLGAPGDGTALYAAPEAAPGVPATAAGDLYAAGAVVFEILAGRPPFDAQDGSELAVRKRTQRPPSAASAGAAVSAKIEAWLERMLAPEPLDRFATARAARQEWCAAMADAGAAAGMDAELLHPLAWQRALELLADLEKGRGGALVLEGERGVGKSTLLGRWSAAAAARGAAVLHVAASPSLPRRPLAAWCAAVQAARSMLGVRQAATLAPRQPRQDEVEMQERLVQALAGAPRRIALAVDAPEACDGTTRRLVLRLAREAERIRIAVCVAHDADAPGRTACWTRNALAELPRAPARLVAPPAARWRDFVAARLGTNRVSDALVEHVWCASAGNLHLGALVLDELRAARALWFADGSWLFRPELAPSGVPASAATLLSRGLLGLEPAARALLETAAVCGSRFDASVVARAAEQPENEVRAMLATLEQERRVVRRAGDAWEFRPPLLASWLVEKLPPERRVALHRDLARALLGATSPDERAIGMHLARAGEAERALPHLERAALAALGARDDDGAIAVLDLACAAADGLAGDEAGVARRVELGLERVRVLQRAAAWEAVEAELATLDALAGGWGLDAAALRAKRQRGEVEYARGRFDAAAACWREAQAIAARLADEHELCELALQLGNIHFERGELDQAAVEYVRTLDWATAHGDRDLEARASHNVAMVESLQGRKQSALGFFDRSMRRFLELGRDDAVARIDHNIGMIYSELGNWVEARNHFRRCIQQCMATGQQAILAVSSLDDAEACLRLGQTAEAEAAIERALATSRERGDQVGVANALRLHASVLAAAGDAAGAEAEILDAVERLRQLGQPLHEGLCWKDLAAIRLGAGRVQAAATALDAAERLFAALDAAEHRAAVESLRARCLHVEEPTCRQ